MSIKNNENKDRLLVSYLLCGAGFLGINGLHRLYNGKTATGLLWLFTCGLFHMGQIYDLLIGVADFGYDLYLVAIASLAVGIAKLLNYRYFRLLDFYFHTLIQQRLLIIPNMVDEYEQNLRLKAGLSPLGIPMNERIFISQVQKPTDKPLIVKLIEAAEANGGSLTVIQGVRATGSGIVEVETILREMLQSDHLRIGNDPISGVVTYYFDEL